MKRRLGLRRGLALACLIALALSLLSGCGETKEAAAITRLEQLGEPGRKIGVASDTAEDRLVAQMFPEAQIEYFKDEITAYTAVRQGKVDAYVYNRTSMQSALYFGMEGVRLLPETLGEGNTGGVALSPVTKIPDLEGKVNTFLGQLRADGTMDDMERRWLITHTETMPEIPVPETSDVHLVVGTTGSNTPFTYYIGTELGGYDIELARRFAAWMGATLEFRVYDYDGIVAAALAGDVDCVFANLFITPEREEAIRFSDPTHVSAIGVLVRDTGAAAAAETAETDEVRWQDYNGKRLGVLVGPLMEDVAAEYFPDSEYFLFNSTLDCATALLAGRIDAFLGDEPGMIAMHKESPEIDYIHETLRENNYAFAFRKNDPASAALCAELNEFLAACWADGTMDELADIWLGDDEARQVVDMSGLTGANGRIRVVTTSTDMPWSYIKDGKNVGYDIDLAVRFCRDRGYALELGDVDYSGRIPAVQSGKYDFSTDMNVTAERKEQVLFSDPTSHGGIVLAVKTSDLAANRAGTEGDDGFRAAETYRSLADFSGKRIGVTTGAIQGPIVEREIPTAETVYFNTVPDLLTALKSDKIDAMALPDMMVRCLMNENEDLTYLADDTLTEPVNIGAIFSKTEAGAALRDEFNTYLARARADGLLEELDRIWFGRDESLKTVLDIASLSGENGTLRLATNAALLPSSYVKDNQIVGQDIDLILRFCRERGYALEIVDMSFSAVVNAVASGKCDFGAGGIAFTEERAASVLFSEPIYAGASVVAYLKTGSERTDGTGAQMTLADLSNAKIGVGTGTNFPEIVLRYLPDAELSYFNTLSDEIISLKSGRIDGFVLDEPGARSAAAADGELAIFPESLGSFDFAFILPKSERGSALCEELSDYLDALRDDGTLERLQSKWFDCADPAALESADYRGLSGEKGTIRLATEQYPPFSLCVDGFYSGYEIELIAMFCRDRGYALEIAEMNVDAVLPAVQSGKCDIGCDCFSITEERRESMLFSTPDYSGGTALVVLKDAAAAETEGGFWTSVRESFEKTFLRENRWKLFVQGIGTTLSITVASILFGTALGFGVYLLCRNGNPIANGVTRFFVWLVHGMPMVVLLMILYYIIFGKVAVSGTVVAVIGFTLVFGASVFGMLKSGVGAVEKGQMEAAYALGYTDSRAFFRVILPQALPHFFPAYKGEITAIIKATAIVGYVAVQDLTKMGDIVRSRTYEAFFPLIAVAVIYFILAGILTAIVNRLGVFIDPRRRKKEDVLKGVEEQ